MPQTRILTRRYPVPLISAVFFGDVAQKWEGGGVSMHVCFVSSRHSHRFLTLWVSLCFDLLLLLLDPYVLTCLSRTDCSLTQLYMKLHKHTLSHVFSSYQSGSGASWLSIISSPVSRASAVSFRRPVVYLRFLAQPLSCETLARLHMTFYRGSFTSTPAMLYIMWGSGLGVTIMLLASTSWACSWTLLELSFISCPSAPSKIRTWTV